VKLGGRNKKSVVFITPYRVGIPKIQDVGPKTVMAQQFGILSELGVKNPDPRNQFIKDLKKGIQPQQKENEIILCIHANEEWGDKSRTVISSIKKIE